MKRTIIALLLAAVVCTTKAYCQTEDYKRVTWGVKASVDVELPGKMERRRCVSDHVSPRLRFHCRRSL